MNGGEHQFLSEQLQRPSRRPTKSNKRFFPNNLSRPSQLKKTAAVPTPLLESFRLPCPPMTSIKKDIPPARKSRSKMKALSRKDTAMVEKPLPAIGVNIEVFTSVKMSTEVESRERTPLYKNLEFVGPARSARRSTTKETVKPKTRPPFGTYLWKFSLSSAGTAAHTKEKKESTLPSPSWNPWTPSERLGSTI